MKAPEAASRAAFLFVLAVVGASFYVWFRDRPAYLLYRLHHQLGKEDQSAAIAAYQKLLRRKDLPREDEIRLRKALGQFYWEASYREDTVFLRSPDDPAYDVDHPFAGLARKEFDRVLELDPNDALAHLHKGLIYLSNGMDKFASDELEAARRSDPQSPLPFLYLARIQLDRSRPLEARDLALQALAIDPNLDKARVVLLDALMQSGDRLRAADEYRRLSGAVRGDPEIRARYALFLTERGRWHEGESEIKAALQTAPANGTVRLYFGRLLLEQGRLDEASAQLAQAGTILRRSAWVILWQIRALTLQGRCEDAARFERILSSSLPHWPWTSVARAWMALCQNRPAGAVQSLDEALALSPDFGEALMLQARIHLDRGDQRQAGEVIRLLLDRKTRESDAFSLLAESLCSQGRYDLAREAAANALEADPKNAWAHIWSAVALAGQNNMEAAGAAADSALEANPSDPDVAAYAALVNGRPMDDLVEIKPSSDRLWEVKGHAEAKAGRWGPALAAYREAARLKPYRVPAWLGIAEAATALKDREVANEALATAARLNPKHAGLQKWRSR